MKEEIITVIDASEAKNLLKGVCDNGRCNYHPIPLMNSQRVRDFVDNYEPKKRGLVKVFYKNGEEMVVKGVIDNKKLPRQSDLDYAYVPLGFIVSGNVTIIKDGKGLKELGEGDFLGLFETSDWLMTGKKRQIGDWTLVANSDTQVIYFSSSSLQEKSVAADLLRSYLVDLARNDHVPQPLSDLPLLDWVASHTTKERPRDCAIIAHTHILPNNVPLFRHLSSLLDFGRIYVVAKPYSTVRSVLNELVWSGFEVIPVQMEANLPYEFAVEKSLNILWQKLVDDQKRRNFKKIIIIDDGGDVWRTIPWEKLKRVKIAAVEQTQRGITRAEGSTLKLPPIVSVATAGIKKIVESEFIGLSVVKKLNNIGALRRAKKVGIVGMGSIGTTIDQALRNLQIVPLSYDPAYHTNHPSSPEARLSLDVLVNECDLIIGTTGTDALKGLPFERIISGEKYFVSASSADIEFASLLKLAPEHSDPFETIKIPVHERLTINILNGGYPVNFDRQNDSTPNDEIVLTRCLMYIGAMQALELIDEDRLKPAIYNLDKIAQAKTLERWIEERNKTENKTHFTKDDIKEIVNFTSLKGGKDMPTVWKD